MLNSSVCLLTQWTPSFLSSIELLNIPYQLFYFPFHFSNKMKGIKRGMQNCFVYDSVLTYFA